MLEAVVEGMLLGLLLSVLIGPVFFLLIQTSIVKGFKSALYLNIGVFISDFVCVLLAHFFAALIARQIKGNMGTYLIGALVLTSFGLHKLLNKKEDKPLSAVKETAPHILMLKGFFLNIVNPSVLLFWIGASTWAIATLESNILIAIYFMSALLVIAMIDFTKIYLAHAFKHTFTETRMKYLNITTGSFLIITGLYLAYIFINSLLQ